MRFVCLQLLGLGILAVGIWAWTEKDTFNNLSKLTNIALDPAFVLILIGKSKPHGTRLYPFADSCNPLHPVYISSHFSNSKKGAALFYYVKIYRRNKRITFLAKSTQ